jgi:hypothetical protein
MKNIVLSGYECNVMVGNGCHVQRKEGKGILIEKISSASLMQAPDFTAQMNCEMNHP